MKKDEVVGTYEVYLAAYPSMFVGKKPVAVIIDGKRIPVNTWSKVYKEVLLDCIKDPARHKSIRNANQQLKSS